MTYPISYQLYYLVTNVIITPQRLGQLRLLFEAGNLMAADFVPAPLVKRVRTVRVSGK